jgi:hypothetical protein
MARAGRHAVPLLLSQRCGCGGVGGPTIGAAVDGRNTPLPDTPTRIRFSSRPALLVVREGSHRAGVIGSGVMQARGDAAADDRSCHSSVAELTSASATERSSAPS